MNSRLNSRLTAVIAFTLAAALCGCGKSETSTGSGSAAPGAAAKEGATTAGAAGALAAKDAEARLKKAGWTIDSSEPGDEDWPSLYIKLSKSEGEDTRYATVWVDSLGESAHEGAPAPHLTMGNGALIRLGWAPSADKKPAPDLAAYAKDVAAIDTPENATDNHLLTGTKFSDAAQKWGLTKNGSRGGGRVSNAGVVFNHAFLDGEAGTLAVEIVHYKGAVEKGEARLVGKTLISVDADDDATKKALYAALGG